MLELLKTVVIDKLKEKSFEYVIIFGLIILFSGYYYSKTEELILKHEAEIAKLANEKERIIKQRNAIMLAYIECSGSMTDKSLIELKHLLQNDTSS